MSANTQRGVAVIAGLLLALGSTGTLTQPALAESGGRETTLKPTDCPGRLGKLPYRSGQQTTDEDQGWVDMLCQYRKKQIRAGDPQAQIRLNYRLPSADPKPIGGDFCWQVRGEPDPEHVSPDKRSGQLHPIGDHFIWVQYHGYNFKAKRARAAAVALARDLVDQSRVLACPGATPLEDPGLDSATPGEGFDEAAQGYAVLAAAYDAREAEVEAMEDAAGADLDAQSRAWTERAEAAEALAAGVESLGLAPEVQPEAAELIAASKEQARLWRLMAGDLSPSSVKEAGFDDLLAAEDAAFRAISERQNAQTALLLALGLQSTVTDSGEDEDVAPTENAADG
jgi:hypothetical protein